MPAAARPVIVDADREVDAAVPWQASTDRDLDVIAAAIGSWSVDADVDRSGDGFRRPFHRSE